MFTVRKAEYEDLEGLLRLYTMLHDNPYPDIDDRINEIWKSIVDDKKQNIIIGELDGKTVSSCTLIIIPNLTHSQRPYALIENVITDEAERGKGYATKCLDYAKGIAVRNNCYKIMLLTGSKDTRTLDFYKHAGYNSNDKTAFIQWLG